MHHGRVSPSHQLLGVLFTLKEIGHIARGDLELINKVHKEKLGHRLPSLKKKKIFSKLFILLENRMMEKRMRKAMPR